MPPSFAKDAQGCHFYSAEGCHFYPALTRKMIDNKDYVKYISDQVFFRRNCNCLAPDLACVVSPSRRGRRWTPVKILWR